LDLLLGAAEAAVAVLIFLQGLDEFLFPEVGPGETAYKRARP